MTRREIQPAGADELAAFLDEVRRLPAATGAPGRRGRLIFALDATASREPTWDSAMSVQGEMFREAGSLGELDVQLAFYRGLDECRASRWVGESELLVQLMTKVTCRAGQTQLRRILRHARNESARQPVQALVFIGDVVEEELDELAVLAGELALRGTRAFLFQEGRDAEARRCFAELARITGGAACRFDRSSPAELRALLAAVAAFAAGGAEALRQLSDRGSAAVRLLQSQVR